MTNKSVSLFAARVLTEAGEVELRRRTLPCFNRHTGDAHAPLYHRSWIKTCSPLCMICEVCVCVCVCVCVSCYRQQRQADPSVVEFSIRDFEAWLWMPTSLHVLHRFRSASLNPGVRLDLASLGAAVHRGPLQAAGISHLRPRGPSKRPQHGSLLSLSQSVVFLLQQTRHHHLFDFFILLFITVYSLLL